MINKNTKIEPFAILLMLMLHHTEERELLHKWIKSKAMGILSTVSEIPVIAGIFVRPHPKKAPVAMSSKHINS